MHNERWLSRHGVWFSLHTCKCVLCSPAQFRTMQYRAESTAAALKGCWYPLQQNLEKTKQTKNNNCSENGWFFHLKPPKKGVVVLDKMPLAERPVTRNCNFWWQFHGQCSKYLDPRKTSIQPLWIIWIDARWSRLKPPWMNPDPLGFKTLFLDLESWIRCTLGRVGWQQNSPKQEIFDPPKMP